MLAETKVGAEDVPGSCHLGTALSHKVLSSSLG